MIKIRLIRPPAPDFTEHEIHGHDRYVCFRYNDGDWIPDDGEPDLAFVVSENGWPFAYGAEWPRYWDRYSHPNNLAFEAAMTHCVSLYHCANGRRVAPLQESP